jgi:hypothetical protein
MVGAAATAAGSGAAAAAVKLGAGVVDGVAVVGKTALTPQALQNAGILKQGAAALVDSLTSSGVPIEKAMTNNLFAGVPGAKTLTDLVNNPIAQVNAQVNNFQQTQTQLTQAGVITGNENCSQIAGLVTATASCGIGETTKFLQTAAAAGSVSGTPNNIGSPANKLLGSVTGAISSGNFAANLTSVVTGGLGSIATSLGGLTKLGGGLSGLLDSAKGVAGSAFDAITKGFPTLKAGVPQNLKQIADKATADVQASGTEASDVAGVLKTAAANSGIDAASIASGVASSATNGLASVTTAVTTGLGASTNLASAAENTVSAVRATLPASTSTGLSNLPGAQDAVNNIVNKAPGALNTIPGTAGITAALGQVNAAVNVSSLPGGASNLVNQLKLPGASLLQFAAAGLGPALAAKLGTSIASLPNGGSPVTVPIIGTNTDGTRPALSTQLARVFGSSKIPTPNYSGNPATTGETAGTVALSKNADEQRELTEKVFAKVAEVREARLAFTKAKNELPAGDPQINELRNKWLALSDELAALNTVA